MMAMIGNALLLALHELRRNVMRSILTMLGIIIGVASVSLLVGGIGILNIIMALAL